MLIKGVVTLILQGFVHVHMTRNQITERRRLSMLSVTEKTVMRRIFGHKKEEVKGDWRRLNDEKLDDKPVSMGTMGYVAYMG
jgi:hypothetical protein